MIEVNHLTKRYGTHCAVKDISFAVGEGEILGFLGPNGAGKSTTMNILTGYLSATEGTVTINGHDILEEPNAAKANIGYLPEIPPLYLDMTVREYLDFMYDLKKCALPRVKHITEICKVMKIEDVYGRLIKNLSKGYRQRVGMAQALIGNPPVLILDEPTVGLDPKQIIEIRNLIRTLGRDHTVILSTHILQEVQAVCDRIIIINKGRVVADELTENINRIASNCNRYQAKICGPQREVLAMLRDRADVAYAEALGARDGDAYVYHIESTKGIDIRKSLFYALSAKGWPLIGLETLGMNLEDIFISVVDKTDESAAPKAKGKKGRQRTFEKDLAQSILDATAAKQESIAPYEGDE